MGNQSKHRKQEKVKISNIGLAILLVSVIIISAALASLFYFRYKIVEVRVLEIDMKINDVGTGIVLDNDIIHLGNLKKDGASTTRQVILTNNYNFPVDIRYTITGNISDMVTVSPSTIIIEAHQNKTIFFSGKATKDIGYYHGLVELKFLRI